MDVHNDSTGWLVLWLEPWGEDRWLKPGETLRVHADDVDDEPPFTVDRFADDDDRAAGIENIAVWINKGGSDVTDCTGAPVECGHQRPQEITAKWKEMLKQMSTRDAGGAPDAGER